jgi:hypothetical protein
VGADHPAPPRPEQRPLRLPRSSWIILVVAVALALAAIALFPRSGGDAPPLASLALIGAVIAAVMATALHTIVRRDLRLPSRAAISFAIAFALIAIVKFVLAPFGLYEVNAIRALDDAFGTVADLGGAGITAASVFALYALGYRMLYWVGLGDRAPIRKRRDDRERAPSRRRKVMVGVALVVLAIPWLVFLVFVVLAAPRQYLEFVFAGAGVVIALALTIAATLIGSAFRTVDTVDGSRVVDVGAIVTMFWLGLGFLALFHVLWMVYVLVLASVWPLKTVTPK